MEEEGVHRLRRRDQVKRRLCHQKAQRVVPVPRVDEELQVVRHPHQNPSGERRGRALSDAAAVDVLRRPTAAPPQGEGGQHLVGGHAAFEHLALIVFRRILDDARGGRPDALPGIVFEGGGLHTVDPGEARALVVGGPLLGKLAQRGVPHRGERRGIQRIAAEGGAGERDVEQACPDQAVVASQRPRARLLVPTVEVRDGLAEQLRGVPRLQAAQQQIHPMAAFQHIPGLQPDVLSRPGAAAQVVDGMAQHQQVLAAQPAGIARFLEHARLPSVHRPVEEAFPPYQGQSVGGVEEHAERYLGQDAALFAAGSAVVEPIEDDAAGERLAALLGEQDGLQHDAPPAARGHAAGQPVQVVGDVEQGKRGVFEEPARGKAGEQRREAHFEALALQAEHRLQGGGGAHGGHGEDRRSRAGVAVDEVEESLGGDEDALAQDLGIRRHEQLHGAVDHRLEKLAIGEAVRQGVGDVVGGRDRPAIADLRGDDRHQSQVVGALV